jgi:methylated-DNA-protein-cysteine methyltransferase related protein
MAVASSRAQAVAEILWELKTAEKLATHSSIAERVGFAPGSGGRIVISCLKTVRRDWPQLQWWRAISNNGQVDVEQQSFLNQNGFETETSGGIVTVKSLAAETMNWATAEAAAEDVRNAVDSDPVSHTK